MEAEFKIFLFSGSHFACLGEESNLSVFEIPWTSNGTQLLVKSNHVLFSLFLDRISGFVIPSKLLTEKLSGRVYKNILWLYVKTSQLQVRNYNEGGLIV